MTLNELQTRAYQTSKDKGFLDLDRTLGDELMLIVTEVAEAMEEYRGGRGPNEVYYSDICKCGPNQACSSCGKIPKPEGLPIEMADAVIRIGQLAEEYGFDLNRAVETKMAYNDTRPKLHGGKRL